MTSASFEITISVLLDTNLDGEPDIYDVDDDGALELARALDTALESGLGIGNGSPLDSGAAATPPTAGGCISAFDRRSEISISPEFFLVARGQERLYHMYFLHRTPRIN